MRTIFRKHPIISVGVAWLALGIGLRVIAAMNGHVAPPIVNPTLYRPPSHDLLVPLSGVLGLGLIFLPIWLTYRGMKSFLFGWHRSFHEKMARDGIWKTGK